ncbi:uncharacterized protein V1510DRAFT_380315 [Dipodascopsis tothii]|uniref:uncharacterized protein n=1 Tax=Dipodascopsis tothii TaxID=44089 RepID=UPI0034CFE541
MSYAYPDDKSPEAKAGAGAGAYRTVVMSNLPPEAEVHLALLHSLVRGGKLEYTHYDAVSGTFAVHFMQAKDAEAYMDWMAAQGTLFINDFAVKLELRPAAHAVPPFIAGQTNVSRKLYLGGIPTDMNARVVSDMFERYGVIEYVKIVWDRKCGWVSFCRAVDAAEALRRIKQDENVFRRSRIEYGRDDCDGAMQEILDGGGVSINARKDVDLVIGKFKHLGRRPPGPAPHRDPAADVAAAY